MEVPRAPLRHLQGRRHARRARHRPRPALGLGRGVEAAGARAARRLGRRRGRDGDGAGRCAAARRARTSRSRTQPRRLAFGRGPLPEGSELELRTGPLEEELRALAAEGVQSLLLEGGPTLATAFLAAGLVDKLLLFLAPVLSGAGPRALGDLAAPLELLHLRDGAFGRRCALGGVPAASRNLCLMFTGIVRDLGTVDAFDGSRLVVAASETSAAAAVGDSVAVAGVCLTVVERGEGRLAFDVVPETLARTALGRLEPGSSVNLEPSLRVGRPARRPRRAGPRRRRGPRPLGRAGRRGPPRLGRRARRPSSATASRRARSRSTACLSRSPPSTTRASRSR